MDTSLRDRTLELLRDRNKLVTFRTIQNETKIKEDWLAKFSQGLIDNPSVNKIQTLYNYLSGHKLDLK